MTDLPPPRFVLYRRLIGIFTDFGRRLKHLFPERQIYIRSKGRVQFYTVSSRAQATISGLGAIFLAWVAFSTVNVIFKDRIIAAKDYRFQRMQTAFENKLAAAQISYDELVATAANAQQSSDNRVVQLDRRQQGLARFLIASHLSYVPDDMSRALTRAVKTVHQGSAPELMDRLLGRLGLRRQHAATVHIYHPSLDRITRDTAMLERWAQNTTGIMMAIESRTLGVVIAQKQKISRTGIDADTFLRCLGAGEGVGGPEIPLSSIKLSGMPDQVFAGAYLKAEANLGALMGLQEAIGRLPTAVPLAGRMSVTSGFGPRLDPFTGRYGFHSGVDFAGAPGTPVLATAGGRVIFAGYNGSYGNMVMLDHGFGLRTRYAHLLSIKVANGQVVAKGAVSASSAPRVAARGLMFTTRSGMTISFVIPAISSASLALAVDDAG